MIIMRDQLWFYETYEGRNIAQGNDSQRKKIDSAYGKVRRRVDRYIPQYRYRY